MKNIQCIAFSFLIFLGITSNASEYSDDRQHTDLKSSLIENRKIQNEDTKKLSCSKINFNSESFKRSALKAARVMFDAYGLYYLMEFSRSWLGKELNYRDEWREWQMCVIAAIVIYPFMYNEA